MQRRRRPVARRSLSRPCGLEARERFRYRLAVGTTTGTCIGSQSPEREYICKGRQLWLRALVCHRCCDLRGWKVAGVLESRGCLTRRARRRLVSVMAGKGIDPVAVLLCVALLISPASSRRIRAREHAIFGGNTSGDGPEVEPVDSEDHEAPDDENVVAEQRVDVASAIPHQRRGGSKLADLQHGNGARRSHPIFETAKSSKGLVLKTLRHQVSRNPEENATSTLVREYDALNNKTVVKECNQSDMGMYCFRESIDKHGVVEISTASPTRVERHHENTNQMSDRLGLLQDEKTGQESSGEDRHAYKANPSDDSVRFSANHTGERWSFILNERRSGNGSKLKTLQVTESFKLVLG